MGPRGHFAERLEGLAVRFGWWGNRYSEEKGVCGELGGGLVWGLIEWDCGG